MRPSALAIVYVVGLYFACALISGILLYRLLERLV